MTAPELAFPKASIDQVVVLEIANETILAKILFVFDGEDTLDVFYFEMDRSEEGRVVQAGDNGYSTLLAEITCVRPLPTGTD